MNRRIKSYLRTLLPRAIREHLILAGSLRGCRIVTSWHDYPAAILGRTERPLLEWFTKNVNLGETWLDMGAHYGYTAIALSRLVGQQGRVFAFEPMVSTAGCLARTRQLNDFPQLIILPLGLAAPGTLEMKQLPVTRGMVDSTLCRKEGGRKKAEGGRQKDERQAVWQETIMVARFDWLWQQICGKNERIDGVKIDVQGMEIEVLQGMLETLRRQRPKLVVEVHTGVDRKELLDLIETVGYSRKAMPIEPVEGEVEPQYVNDLSYYFKAV
jgi:FkbM family methyltransferase